MSPFLFRVVISWLSLHSCARNFLVPLCCSNCYFIHKTIAQEPHFMYHLIATNYWVHHHLMQATGFGVVSLTCPRSRAKSHCFAHNYENIVLPSSRPNVRGYIGDWFWLGSFPTHLLSWQFGTLFHSVVLLPVLNFTRIPHVFSTHTFLGIPPTFHDSRFCRWVWSSLNY